MLQHRGVLPTSPAMATNPMAMSASAYAMGGAIPDTTKKRQFGRVDSPKGEKFKPEENGSTGVIQDMPMNDDGQDPALDQLRGIQRDMRQNNEGVIPSGASVGPNTDDTTTKLASAMDVVNQVLNYGRKKYGLPGNRDEQAPDQARPSMNDATAAPMNKPFALPDATTRDDQGNSEEEPPAYADGGAVEDDTATVTPAQPDQDQAGVLPAQGQQQMPPQITAYLSGKTNLNSKHADQIEKAVDPHGQMHERERRLMAVQTVAEKLGPDPAFDLMQFYRQKYDAYRALARAATNGVQQHKKPTQAFADGGTVDEDTADDPTGAVQTQEQDSSSPKEERRKRWAREQGVLDANATPTDQPDTGPSRDNPLSPDSIKEKALELYSKAWSYLPTHMPLPVEVVRRWSNYINGPSSLYDTVLENTKQPSAETSQAVAGPTAPSSDAVTEAHVSDENTATAGKREGAGSKFKPTVAQPLDPVKQSQAQALHPWASQGQERSKFLEGDVQEQGKQESAERIATLHGEQLANAAQTRANTSTANNQNTNETRRRGQDIQAKGIDNKQMQFLQKLEADARKANNSEQAKTIRAIITAGAAGTDADQVNEQLKKLKLPQLPVQVQSAPQAPTVGQNQPVQIRNPQSGATASRRNDGHYYDDKTGAKVQ